MKKSKNLEINNGYGVFCIALQLSGKLPNDIRWVKALKLYDEFIDSDFNDPNESELDCIYKFMECLIKK
jgi:hypothetical protein